jgi:vitamin B12 transporter
VALGMLVPFAAAFPIAALAGDPGPAGSPSPSPSPTPPPEIGRVSTSDRHDEPIDRTTRATYVVDRAHIEARGEPTVADALADVPGVDVFHYGAFGAQADIFVRGASPTSVLILVDGVPITPGSNEQLDLGSFSTVGVRRIEVVEGSGATLYGSNAVGGVINIITDVPRSTYLAANDYGYAAIPVPGATPIPAGTRVNADAEQTAARGAYDVDLGSNISARLRFGADQTQLGVPGSLLFGADPYARQNVSRDDLHLDLTHTGASSAFTLTLAGLHQDLDYVDPSTATETPTLDGRAQVSLRNVIAAGPSTLTAGIDIARESAVLANIAQYNGNSGPTGYATTGQTQSATALYAQEQYALRNGVLLSAGIRGENDAPLGSAATPSLGVGVPLAEGVRIVVNAGTAFRVPTIVDRYYPGYANPNLRPERSKDADLTLQDHNVLGGMELGYFLRDSTNLIQLDSAYVPQNVARASVRGLYGTLRTRPYHGFISTLSVTDTYRADNASPGLPMTRLFFTPVVAAKLGLERPFGSGVFAFGAQADVLGPHAESAGFNPDGEATVDVYVRGRLARDTMLTLRARNIGNDTYQPVLGYPAPGRTIELELSTR